VIQYTSDTPSSWGCRQYRHLLARGHDESFQRLRETRSPARPRHFHLGRLLASRTGNTRHTRLQHGLILEEVQVSPGSLQSIMNRLVYRPTTGASQPLGGIVDLEVIAPSAGRKSTLTTHHGALSPSAWVKSCSIDQACGLAADKASQAKVNHTNRERASIRGTFAEALLGECGLSKAHHHANDSYLATDIFNFRISFSFSRREGLVSLFRSPWRLFVLGEVSGRFYLIASICPLRRTVQ